ncbi:MAG: fibrobacter succinogenes major paralogous domain-containing protein [Draconibacterium sp.]
MKIHAVLFALVLTIANQINAQTDHEGKIYPTVKIGQQVWMSENLSTGMFSNGDPIPEAKTEEEWVKAGEAGKPAWMAVPADANLGETAGKLYNGFTVTDPRGLAPKGWHIPTDEEWNNLAGSLGGKEAATLKLKSKTGWTEGAEGTNESGFNGLPAGKITPDGYAEDYIYFGFWWSNTPDEEFQKNRNLDSENYPFDSASSFRQAGLSVRCVKD